ncbi:MAG: hypothetical protein AAF529_22210, partial [Pseudomonadota bacterium]
MHEILTAPTKTRNTATLRYTLVGLLIAGLVALSWSGHMDTLAEEATSAGFKRALAAAALARGLNGVISVAQGTEVAIQPVGIGVTLTLGEILDPINDLVERFALLALVASVSMGLQMLLAEVFANFWFSVLLTAAAVMFLGVAWLRLRRTVTTTPAVAPPSPLLYWSARLLGALLFIRFVTLVVVLVTAWIDHAFLAERHDQAVAQIQITQQSIDRLQDEQQANTSSEERNSILSSTSRGIRQILDHSAQTLDMRSQLTE